MAESAGATFAPRRDRAQRRQWARGAARALCAAMLGRGGGPGDMRPSGLAPAEAQQIAIASAAVRLTSPIAREPNVRHPTPMGPVSTPYPAR